MTVQGKRQIVSFNLPGDIPDWEKLKQVGEFDPTYLHLESNQAAA